jgi:hypothetical protein
MMMIMIESSERRCCDLSDSINKKKGRTTSTIDIVERNCTPKRNLRHSMGNWKIVLHVQASTFIYTLHDCGDSTFSIFALTVFHISIVHFLTMINGSFSK